MLWFDFILWNIYDDTTYQYLGNIFNSLSSFTIYYKGFDTWVQCSLDLEPMPFSLLDLFFTKQNIWFCNVQEECCLAIFLSHYLLTTLLKFSEDWCRHLSWRFPSHWPNIVIYVTMLICIWSQNFSGIKTVMNLIYKVRFIPYVQVLNKCLIFKCVTE